MRRDKEYQGRDQDLKAETHRQAGRPAKTGKPSPPSSGTFGLQRKVGNQAFGQMLREDGGRESETDKEVPGVVRDVLHSPGQPLDPGTRTDMESRFGHDFSQISVHADSEAAKSASAVDAEAYTVGKDLVFAAGRYQPHSSSGRRLLAHELTHAMQQAEAAGPSTIAKVDDPGLEAEAKTSETKPVKRPSQKVGGRAVLQRTPAAPTDKSKPVPYDRALVTIGLVSDVVIGSTGPQSISANITAAGANHLSWELYNSDDDLIYGISTLAKSPNPLTSPCEINDSRLAHKKKQGRYTLRCVARQDGKPVAYADQTFFVWTTTPLSAMKRSGLGGIMSSPSTHTLGELGAAKARDMMLQHQETLAATGTGTVMGNQCTVAAPGGVAKSDCTQYVYDILKYAFGAKGSASLWADVAAEAARLSGSGGLRGTALQKALETKANWKGIFWAPSPRNPEDSSSEHPVAYKRVREKGLYSSDDVAVDSSHSVIDFRPKSTTTQPAMTDLDQLKKVPLGVISARGGTHMTLLINGQVYEVHWDKPPTDPDVIEATPLERWQWQSGVVVMPDESFKAAFGP